MNTKPSPVSSELVRFGDFVLELQSGELRHGGAVVALRPLASRCLVLLVSRAGQLVTLDELREELWGTTVVEWRGGIHQAIRQIRQALGDDCHDIVQTVTRRGYRFQLPVSPIASVGQVDSSARFRGPRVYAAGFATPIAAVALFFIWCGSLS